MAQQITLSAKALVAAAKAQIKEYTAEEAIGRRGNCIWAAGSQVLRGEKTLRICRILLSVSGPGIGNGYRRARQGLARLAGHLALNGCRDLLRDHGGWKCRGNGQRYGDDRARAQQSKFFHGNLSPNPATRSRLARAAIAGSRLCDDIGFGDRRNPVRRCRFDTETEAATPATRPSGQHLRFGFSSAKRRSVRVRRAAGRSPRTDR